MSLSIVLKIAFAPHGEHPRNAVGADFWDGLLDFNTARKYPAPVAWTHTSTALCNKHGIKHPSHLRAEQSRLGCPVVEGLRCRKCNVEVFVKPLCFPSRLAFETFLCQQLYADCFCESCRAVHAAEQAKQSADEKAAKEVKRAKLRERYGAQYVKDCPSCPDGVLYFRQGQYPGSVFIACSSYLQGCRHREPMPKPTPPPDMEVIARAKLELEQARKCPKCDAALTMRNGPRGPFVGCTGYARGCRYSENIPTPSTSSVDEDVLIGRFE
jgi:ssDNA-binding Zn-finger/Zn-ribbon topoisomerase 1